MKARKLSWKHSFSKANHISPLVIIENWIYISLGKQKEIEAVLKTLNEDREFPHYMLDIIV